MSWPKRPVRRAAQDCAPCRPARSEGDLAALESGAALALEPMVHGPGSEPRGLWAVEFRGARVNALGRDTESPRATSQGPQRSHKHMGILDSGAKAQDKSDSTGHGFYVVFWALVKRFLRRIWKFTVSSRASSC